MQFLLLIAHEESSTMKMPETDLFVMSQEYAQFTQGIIDSGKYIGGNRLKPVSTATTVRVRDGKRLVTDGPFAETKEQLGGYYLINATDLDDAVAIAARIPGARHGSIEVRPVFVQEQAATK